MGITEQFITFYNLRNKKAGMIKRNPMAEGCRANDNDDALTWSGRPQLSISWEGKIVKM